MCQPTSFQQLVQKVRLALDSRVPFPPAAKRRVPRARLALRAKMAAAPCNHNAGDGGTAAPAWPARSLVNAQVRKKISRTPFDVDVVAEAGALEFDGALQHTLEGAQKAASLVSGNPARLRQRVEPREVQSFIGINVSHAGDNLLVHQPTFQRAAPAAQ